MSSNARVLEVLRSCAELAQNIHTNLAALRGYGKPLPLPVEKALAGLDTLHGVLCCLAGQEGAPHAD
ncbi:MAG: hypothetical protein V2A73_07465 [Pseudomonadota bacterium]